MSTASREGLRKSFFKWSPNILFFEIGFYVVTTTTSFHKQVSKFDSPSDKGGRKKKATIRKTFDTHPATNYRNCIVVR